MDLNTKPFEVLLNRQLSDKEIQNLYRLKNVLQIQDNDALWLVLIALESYNTLYNEYPDKISKALSSVINNERDLAKSLLDDEVKRALATLIEQTSKQIRTESGRNAAGQHMQLIGIVSLVLLAFAALCVTVGYLVGSHGTLPYWLLSNQGQMQITGILKIPAGLVMSLIGAICCLLPLYLNKDAVLSGKRFDIIIFSVIFAALSIFTFVSII